MRRARMNPAAPACCEILAEIFQYFDIEITKPLGTCILTGIITDTGGFRYSGVTAETFEFAAQMLDLGVNKVKFTACPVAFGEVSIKTRIKSVISYKRAGRVLVFASLCVCVIVAVCFMTEPEVALKEKTEVQDDLAGVLSKKECLFGIYYAGFYTQVSAKLQQMTSFYSLDLPKEFLKLLEDNSKEFKFLGNYKSY